MRNYKSAIFQHRHYAAIAKVLYESHANENLIYDFADAFERDNPKFDRERFTQAARGVITNGKDKR